MKRKILISVLIGLFALTLSPQTANAQFGKNMVIKRINWRIYESPHFEIYFYVPNEKNLTNEEIEERTKKYVAKLHRWTETAYAQISKEIAYDMPIDKKEGHGKPRIIFYWSRYDAQHHPLGPPGGAIAYAEPTQMREICVSLEYTDEKTQQIVTHETTHLFQFSLWKMAKKTPGQLSKVWRNFLTFLFEGWAQHTSRLHETEPNARLLIRYWVLNDGLRYINIKDWVLQGLSGSYEICYVLAGYFYDYLEQTYGKYTFRNFVTEFRNAKPTAKGFEKAVSQVLRTDFAELDRGFRKYLEEQYEHFPIEKKEASEYGRDILIQRRLLPKGPFAKKKVNAAYEPVIVPPAGDLVAAFIVKKDNIRVALISAKDGTVVKELTGGYSLYKYGLWPVIDLHGPGRALSATSDYVLYFAQTTGKNPVLVLIGIVTGKVEKVKIKLDDPESPGMSKDGKTVIFSAIQNGQRDIFSLNLETKEIKNLTNDEQFDHGPSFSPDNKRIVYVASINSYNKLFSLDLATLEKKQMTFGPSNEIRPIYSRDGKTIWFISDQDKDKTYNIYSFDVENSKVAQWTDVINSIHNVVPMKDKTLLVGAVGYRDSRHLFTYNLYEVDLDKIEPTTDANGLVEFKDPEPQKTQIEAEEIDLEKIRKYSSKFNLVSGQFWGGADTRFGIYGMGHIYVADLLKTKHIQVNIVQFGKYYKYNTLSYFNISRRLEWGAVAAFENHHFYPWFVSWGGFNPYGQPAIDPVLYQLRFKRTKLSAVAIYPLDLCHRLEFSLGGASVKYAHSNWQANADYYASQIETLPNDPIFQLYSEDYRKEYLAQLTDVKEKYELRADFLDRYIHDGKFATINLAFIRDTARFKRNIGPLVNDMYRIDLSLSTGGYNAVISTEGRKYFRLGNEWVFALRGYGGIQWGKTINPWIIGDLGELRGYKWMQFMGNRIWLANIELRLPLTKNFNLLGIYLGDIRAALFMDMAKIWFDDKRFNALNADDINPDTIKGSIGLDLTLGTVPILGMPLHVAFSKRMIKVKFLPKFEKDWQIKFYFGYSF